MVFDRTVWSMTGLLCVTEGLCGVLQKDCGVYDRTVVYYRRTVWCMTGLLCITEGLCGV